MSDEAAKILSDEAAKKMKIFSRNRTEPLFLGEKLIVRENVFRYFLIMSMFNVKGKISCSIFSDPVSKTWQETAAAEEVWFHSADLKINPLYYT